MAEGYLPIKEIICGGSSTYFSGKNFGHICTTCIGHMFVYHMYFWYVDACKGAQYVVMVSIFNPTIECGNWFVWSY
jgi:hypothetical protein